MSVPFQYPRLVTPIRLTDKPASRRRTAKPTFQPELKKWAVCGVTAILRLARVQLDDHRFVDVASDISAIRSLLEGACELIGVDFNPLRQALAGSQVKRFANAQLRFGFLADRNHVTRLDQHGSDVCGV